MLSMIKSLARCSILFLFPRYPFVNALTFLLLLGERAATETYPPFDPKVIYIHVGLFFLCAVGMGFECCRRLSAVIHAAHLLCFAYIVCCNETLGYRMWIKVRMAQRMVGVAGFFVLYAYFSNPGRRQKLFKRVGEVVVGAYVLMATYTVLQSPEDKEAFLRFIPGFHGTLFVYATLLAAVGLCYLPGQFVYDLTVVLLLVLTVSTCLVDTQFNYWTKIRGLHFWNQVRLMSDNFALIGGSILYLSCSKSKLD